MSINSLKSYLTSFFDSNPWRNDEQPANSKQVADNFKPYNYHPSFNDDEMLEWVTYGLKEESKIDILKVIQEIDNDQQKSVIRNASSLITSSMNEEERISILHAVAGIHPVSRAAALLYTLESINPEMNAADRIGILNSIVNINSPKHSDKSIPSEEKSAKSYKSMLSQENLIPQINPEVKEAETISVFHTISNTNSPKHSNKSMPSQGESVISYKSIKIQDPISSIAKKVFNQPAYNLRIKQRFNYKCFNANGRKSESQNV